MLRKPGICQKPVITLYETPAYAACGTAVGAEPTGVPENGGVADEILFGWQYEVLEENNAFYKIRTHYGYEGWIAAEEYVPVEGTGSTGACHDAQNSGCAMELFQVCQNIADVLEAERVQARCIMTLYAGSLIWAEKDSALGDSSAAARLLQPGWRRVFLPDGMGGLRGRKNPDGECRGHNVATDVEMAMASSPTRAAIRGSRATGTEPSE